MPTSFSKLLADIATGVGSATLEVPDDWLQGRTLFGGLQAVIGLAAMRTVAPSTALRSMQVTFLAPVPGGPVRAVARVLRSGKNTAHVEARIVEGDNTLCLMVGVFGVGRESSVALRPAQAPVHNDQAIELPWIPGVVPNFTQHFRARWMEGAPPSSGAKDPRSVVELAMRDPGPVSEYHVVAMADFIPPVALSWLKTMAPAASLNWMLEMLSEDVGSLALEGWRVDAEMTAAAGGYTHQSLVLWGPGGVPVALGRQTMVVFG